MSQGPLYLDRYFPKLVQDQPSPNEAKESFGSEEYWDFDVGEAETMADDENSLSEQEMEADNLPAELENTETPTAEQQKLVDWLEKHGETLDESYQEAQGRFQELQEGAQDLAPQDKAKRLREIEETLAKIENDLQEYQGEEKKLEASGLENDSLDSDLNSEEIEDDLTKLKEGLKEELEKTQEAVVDAEEREAKAEQKSKENEAGKEQFLGALGFLNGTNGERYFTANVWGKKHIKDYHEDVTENASRIVSQMADAIISGDWEIGVKASIDSLSSGSSDNTLALVYVVLEKQDPQLFKKIPSEILEAMSDAIRRGNSPGDKNIYYIHQDGKYDTPKDDRRRKDMSHENISYAEAADQLRAYAEAKRDLEKAEAEEMPSDAEAAAQAS